MDAIDKMAKDIREIAEQTKNGFLPLPQITTPVIVAEVEDGKVIEVEIRINGNTVKHKSDL